MAARFLDDHVVAQVLSALALAALELSVTAARQAEGRRAEVDRIWCARSLEMRMKATLKMSM